jgi:hypothetical protein
MTLLGIAWLLLFVLVFYGLVKLTLWLVAEEPKPVRKSRGPAPDPGKDDEPVAREPELVPSGWTVSDYAADGIKGLQVLLVQAARRSAS